MSSASAIAAARRKRTAITPANDVVNPVSNKNNNNNNNNNNQEIETNQLKIHPMKILMEHDIIIKQLSNLLNNNTNDNTNNTNNTNNNNIKMDDIIDYIDKKFESVNTKIEMLKVHNNVLSDVELIKNDLIKNKDLNIETSMSIIKLKEKVDYLDELVKTKIVEDENNEQQINMLNTLLQSKLLSDDIQETLNIKNDENSENSEHSEIGEIDETILMSTDSNDVNMDNTIDIVKNEVKKMINTSSQILEETNIEEDITISNE